ncbi:AraC family transcriptional regulator [Oceanicoccus sp. KOV_DT_Chl]|uniref:AraC family transcriptional regulator n=1 Tax=Oceanicoccus sp. KOV_DT_Chl TaxID=1904639 RepID=UPI000C7B7385|nr:AraC family transcriptional regulator [Oceanicoccus sp. KOV_DT_Chl]
MALIKDRKTFESSLRRAASSEQVTLALKTISTAGEARLGPVIVLPKVLKNLGVAPEKVLLKAGIKTAVFSNADNRMARGTLDRLLECSASLTQRTDIGLLIGEYCSLDDFGIIGNLMRHSTTVGEALRVLVLYLHLHDRFAVPVILRSDSNYVFLGYSTQLHSNTGATYLHDLAMAVAYKILAELCGASWKPLQVQFAHYPPKVQRPYKKFFGTHIRFNAEVSGVLFASSWLDQAVEGADLRQRTSLINTINNIDDRGALTFAEQVQRMLPQLLLSGDTSSASVARLFGISERRLRQRLQQEGSSMQQILAKTRLELAQQLLHETQLPIAEIATALCYADTAVFSRAFRHWTGFSPRQWRDKRVN